MNGIQMVFNDDGVMVPEIAGGSVKVGDILHQNQTLILMLHKGEVKEDPTVGVGISDMLLDNDPLYWRTEIKEQLERDGMTVERVVINTRSIDIDAKYKQ